MTYSCILSIDDPLCSPRSLLPTPSMHVENIFIIFLVRHGNPPTTHTSTPCESALAQILPKTCTTRYDQPTKIQFPAHTASVLIPIIPGVDVEVTVAVGSKRTNCRRTAKKYEGRVRGRDLAPSKFRPCTRLTHLTHRPHRGCPSQEGPVV